MIWWKIACTNHDKLYCEFFFHFVSSTSTVKIITETDAIICWIFRKDYVIFCVYSYFDRWLFFSALLLLLFIRSFDTQLSFGTGLWWRGGGNDKQLESIMSIRTFFSFDSGCFFLSREEIQNISLFRSNILSINLIYWPIICFDQKHTHTKKHRDDIVNLLLSFCKNKFDLISRTQWLRWLLILTKQRKERKRKENRNENENKNQQPTE